MAFDQVAQPSAFAYAPSSSTQPKLLCDVFINYRGPDVRQTLVEAIYEKLSSIGVQVFMDEKALEPGDSIPTILQQAMDDACLYVAIFSKRYAESAWCLAELSYMLKTGVKIIPIFYHVDPSDFRLVDKGKGIYSVPFAKHKAKCRYTAQRLREWKEALQIVSYIAGYVLNNEYDWGVLLDEIAKVVLNEIRRQAPNEIFTSHTTHAANDIFISHRALDTKKNLERLIYNRLRQCELRVFLDEEDPEAGDILPSAISSVISRSSVHVAIFSVSYAESSWCLNVLWEMLQSGRKVIPIFYDIKSEDVCNIENGRYARAFLIHQKKSRHLVVERWKAALRDASNIPEGKEFNTEEDDLERLLDEVVKEVLKKPEASEVFDIFINHRGPDTKKSVASLLYRRLVSYGLRVFLDQEELQVGDDLSPAIRSAIRSSSVHVAIFSVAYVQSPWCLNELLEMLESDGKVIPIFYDVKPSDLRNIETGHYRRDFQALQNKRNRQNNERRHKAELVDRWKDALQRASNISGMEFKTAESHFGNFVEDIVEKVLKETRWEPLYIAEHPLGLHQAAEDFDIFLKERRLRGTTVVGITGLNGLGKSTLVKHLYNCNLESHKFKRYCFLELNKKDLAMLQQQLLRELMGGDKYRINDTTKGKKKLETCLRGCGPVLIVLDGLEKEEQIESLLSVVKKNVLARGSLILVTCHDKDLLKGQVNLFYEVNGLHGKDAKELFCLYAFHSSTPPKELEDLVEKYLKICCGFPLALKVLGRKLYVDLDQNRRDGEENRRYWEENRIYWEEQLKELSRPKIPKDIVREILKVVYDDLEEEKKEVFLDIAHFLVGEDTHLAVRVLEGLHDISGLLCLKELQSKYLLDLEEIEHCKRPVEGPPIRWRTKGNSKIRMHELVRNMARQIASEDSYSSPKTKPVRLCQLDNKSILQQLQFRGYHVKGIRCEDVDESERHDRDIKEPQLRRCPLPLPNMDKPEMSDQEIRGLRLLVLHDVRVPFPFNRLSGDLIWLRMHKSNWGNSNTTPSTLSLRNLRVLELDGVKLEALGRMDGGEVSTSLANILDTVFSTLFCMTTNITDCMSQFPSKLGELTVNYCGESLEIPKLADKNFMEASSSASGSVWNWLRELRDLVKMVIKNVKGLKSLPIDFEALTKLRHLDMSGWSDLENMPDSFTGLLQLQYLALQHCVSLSISDLGGITKLEYLDFEGCSVLQKLPNKTTAQQELRYLNLVGTSIKELPLDLKQLNKLELFTNEGVEYVKN